MKFLISALCVLGFNSFADAAVPVDTAPFACMTWEVDLQGALGPLVMMQEEKGSPYTLKDGSLMHIVRGETDNYVQAAYISNGVALITLTAKASGAKISAPEFKLETMLEMHNVRRPRIGNGIHIDQTKTTVGAHLGCGLY